MAAAGQLRLAGLPVAAQGFFESVAQQECHGARPDARGGGGDRAEQPVRAREQLLARIRAKDARLPGVRCSSRKTAPAATEEHGSVLLGEPLKKGSVTALIEQCTCGHANKRHGRST